MTIAVTLNLPENVVKHAEFLGGATRREVEAVLEDALEMMWPMLEGLPAGDLLPSISSLSDQQVLQLADSKMDEAQNERLGQLQTQGKEKGLNAAERYELLALLQIYQLGQLRKSEGLAEVGRRGLREPMPG
jgi:hypothetical protein